MASNKPAKKPEPQKRVSVAQLKLPPAPVLIVIAAAVICLGLVYWIFAPHGLLDTLTGTQEVQVPETLPETEQEVEVTPDLSSEKNAAFLAENAKKAGVKVTASGLQYRQISPGTGKQPGPTSHVTVHYAGALINGKEFDSSRGHDPITFGLNQVIPGWTEGLQLMREGEKAELVIPEDIGYGARGAPGAIPPYQTLVFQVELIKVR
jgi:FKBP-type peptidyl-prolyl cis-trans isomerase